MLKKLIILNFICLSVVCNSFSMKKLIKDAPQLNLNVNGIKKIEGLKKLPNLTILYLTCNKIKKIEDLENLTQLKELFLNVDLPDNRIMVAPDGVDLEKFDIQERGLKGFVKALKMFPWCILVGYDIEEKSDEVIIICSPKYFMRNMKTTPIIHTKLTPPSRNPRSLTHPQFTKNF